MLRSSGCAILQPCISIPSLRRFIAGALSRPEMYQRFFRLCRRRLQGMRNSKAASSKRRQRWAHGSCSWTHGPSSRSIPTSVQSTRQPVHHMARAVLAGPAVRRGHLDRSGTSGSEQSSDEEQEHRSKRAKPSTPGPTQRMPTDIGDTIPCSSPVVGSGLGKVEDPKHACTTCHKKGHWRVDCPVRWAQAGKQLPGFGPNGKRLKRAWEDDNPTKETFAKWVTFLQDTDNFPNGARTFPKPGAPSIKSFKKAARSGAPK